MEIIVDLGFKKQLLKKIADREFSERTGVHCTDLIYCLNKQALRKLHPIETKEADLLLFSLGWSTQRWITGQDEDAPEVEIDGIKVTPDAVFYRCPSCGAQAWCECKEDFVPIVWELKCTFQSSARPIEENVHQIRQIMAQCYVTGSTTAYLSRLEIMGDWKSVFKPRGFKDWSDEEQKEYLDEHRKPTLNAYRLEFTQDELDRNWEWLKARRELYLGVLETGKLLPKAEALASGMAFECSYCVYQGTECSGV